MSTVPSRGRPPEGRDSRTARRVITQPTKASSTRSWRRRWLAGLAIGLAALAATACVGGLTPKGGWASPVPAGDWVYQATRNGRLIRMDATSGQVDAAWQYPAANQDTFGVIYGTPLVTDDAVYAAAYTCKGDQCNARVYAVSTLDATPLWSDQYYSLATEIVGTLALYGDTLLFGTSNIGRDKDTPGYLYAIDATADFDKPLAERVGDRFQWRIPADGKVWGGVAIDGDTAYFGSTGHTLYAVDLAASSAEGGGRLVWQFESSGAFVATPLVASGKVYIGDFDGKLFQLDPSARKSDLSHATLNSSREWAADLTGWVWSRPALRDGVLYAGTLGGNVYALDAASGRALWEKPARIDGEVIGAPIVLETARPVLAVPSGESDVWVIDLISGSVLGEFATRSAVDAEPVSAGGFVYVHSRNDQLQTFAVGTRALINCIDTIDRRACS